MLCWARKNKRRELYIEIDAPRPLKRLGAAVEEAIVAGKRRHRVTAGYLLALLKRKPYCTIAELRRRIEPAEDEEEMLPISTLGGTAWVGLPEGHAHLLSDLEAQGKLGLEMSVEFDARVVIGVYAPSRTAQAQLNRRRGQRPPAPAASSHEEARPAPAAAAAAAVADAPEAGSSAA